jgi:hypothetical protein
MKYSSNESESESMFIGGYPKNPLDNDWEDFNTEFMETMEKVAQMSELKGAVKELLDAVAEKYNVEKFDEHLQKLAEATGWFKKPKAKEPEAKKQDVSFVSYSNDPVVTLKQIRTIRESIYELDRILTTLTLVQNPPNSGKMTGIDGVIEALENLKS